MNFRSVAIASLVVLLSTTLSMAHSPMKSTSPANEAKLDAEPDKLHMIFAKPARVLKVVMTHSINDAVHEERLELPTKDAVEEMLLTPKFMGAGNYKVEWRALGTDGHALKGDFSFDVEG